MYDSVHITQIAGRLKNNLKDLIIVLPEKKPCRDIEKLCNMNYIEKSKNNLLEMFYTNIKKPLLLYELTKIVKNNEINRIRILKASKNQKYAKFFEFLNKNYIMCNVKIYGEERNKILDFAKKNRIIGNKMRDYSFNKIIKFIESKGGIIKKSMTMINGKNQKYHLILPSTFHCFDMTKNK